MPLAGAASSWPVACSGDDFMRLEETVRGVCGREVTGPAAGEDAGSHDVRDLSSTNRASSPTWLDSSVRPRLLWKYAVSYVPTQLKASSGESVTLT